MKVSAIKMVDAAGFVAKPVIIIAPTIINCMDRKPTSLLSLKHSYIKVTGASSKIDSQPDFKSFSSRF